MNEFERKKPSESLLLGLRWMGWSALGFSCGPVVVLLDVAHYTQQVECEYQLNNNIKTQMNGTCPKVSLWGGIVYWSRLRKTQKSINNDDTRESLVFNMKCLIGDCIFKQVLISK